jgi:hypothetical protein
MISSFIRADILAAFRRSRKTASLTRKIGSNGTNFYILCFKHKYCVLNLEPFFNFKNTDI